MSLKTLIDDIIGFYLWQGKQWLVFTYLVTAAVSAVITVYGIKNGIKKSKIVCQCLLVFWIITVITLTILCRSIGSERKYKLIPFWSWRLAISGNRRGILLVIENILLLMPIGFLLPLINRDRWNIRITILIGFLFSLGIELCQILTKRGQFEFDDLINNTLGVFIGYLLAILALSIWDCFLRQQNTESDFNKL